ncbi:NADH-quinone oxidoreductase subunit K [Thermaurantiacus sp.]
MPLPLEDVPLLLLAMAGGLFLVGLVGLLVRPSLLFQLLGLELMLAGAALGFVAAGLRAKDGLVSGQAMLLLVLAVAAAEAGLGLALYLRLGRAAGSDDTDHLRSLHD